MGKGIAKRVFSAVMAASLLLSNFGTPNLVLAEETDETLQEELRETEELTAETDVLQTEAAKYRIILPKYEEMDYRYQDSKFDTEYMAGSTDNQVRAALLYEAGETVEFSVVMDEAYQLETIELIDEAKHKQSFEWNDHTVKFVMPEKDLKLTASFTEVLEATETSLVSENDPEETSGNDPPAEQEAAIDGVIVTVEDGKVEGTDSVIVEEEVSETDATEGTTYTEVLEDDGLPKQGSIVQAEKVEIPFDTWEFDVKNDYTNISYVGAGYQIEYVSDDIVYDAAGTYSAIYKVTEPYSGKFWFVLRPIVVMDKEESQAAEVSERETAAETAENTAHLEEDPSEEITESVSEASEGANLDFPDTLVYYSPEVDETTAEAIEEHDEMIMLSTDDLVFAEEEAAEVMLLAASPKTVKSKTFTGKNLIESMTGINRVTNYDFGSSPNAYNSFSVALSSTAKADIESYLSANNDAFTYTHTTTQDVLAEKRYGLLLIDTPIYEYQQETARAIGAAASGNLVYILQELGNGWCFVESGDVRGFTRRSNILLGDTAEDTVKMMGEEKVTLAEELIEPEENRSCYFTLTSTKLASDGMGEEIAKTALTYVGNLPYIWGGTSLEAGADCSGFVQGVYASKGINIPRLAEEQGVSGILISSLSEAKPGDIVYWASGPHVGIYIGDGKVIQCSGDSSNTWGNPGKGVTISNVDYMPITSIRRYLVTAGADNGSFAKDRSGYSQAELELIWAIVAQEDNGSYEGALAVISSAMNRTESSSWSYLGSNVLSQLTASGQYCYSLDNYWKGRLHGNVPDYVKQAVYDCLHKGIRNHKYTSFRSQNGAASNYSAVQIGGNWFFGS